MEITKNIPVTVNANGDENVECNVLCDHLINLIDSQNYFCHIYQKIIKITKDRKIYRCKQCIKDFGE